MRIAFYAPLKAPDHPVPSGDRQMSRLLIAALRHAGYEVEVASALRAYMSEPSVNALSSLAERACAEIARLEREWQASGPPDLWFTYHPYYKAPDLIGPALCGRFNIPYITAEASYAGKRDIDGWAPAQRKVIAGVSAATVNLCFTGRDRDGLARAAPDAVFDDLRPFIDTAPFTDEPKRTPKQRLVTVAMMRHGDKLESFTRLAAALDLMTDHPLWHLTIIGDGPAKREIRALFERFDPKSIAWAGEIASEKIAKFLYDADLYVWPGCGEAYGLAYLEAERCLNCDIQTVFTGQLCIECDACVDICPMDCITFTDNGEEGDLRQRLKAPSLHPDQDLYVSSDLKTGRVMVKDEDVCLHCGLCAERCPTGAWDMQKYLIDMTHAGSTCQSKARSAA